MTPRSRGLSTGPPPAAGLPLGGRACTDASESALRFREEGAEATTPALAEPAAVVADGGAPAEEAGSPKGADLALAADPAPGECLSEANAACFATPPFLLCHLTSSFFFATHARFRRH